MRGDVYELRPARRDARHGHEQDGSRFAVVVQATRLEHLSTWLVVPTSTRARPFIFRPLIEVPGRGETLAMCDMLSAADPQGRLGRYIGFLPLSQLHEIDVALTGLLDLG